MLARKEMFPPKGEESRVVTIPPNPLPRLELLFEEDDEPTIRMKRPLFEEKVTGPNWGALAAIAFCLAFWCMLMYMVFVYRG